MAYVGCERSCTGKYRFKLEWVGVWAFCAWSHQDMREWVQTLFVAGYMAQEKLCVAEQSEDVVESDRSSVKKHTIQTNIITWRRGSPFFKLFFVKHHCDWLNCFTIMMTLLVERVFINHHTLQSTNSALLHIALLHIQYMNRNTWIRPHSPGILKRTI